MATIKVSSIGMPEHYVRGNLNSKNINDLMDVVVKHHGHLFKDGAAGDWHDLIGKKLTWPFYQPIIVARNPEPPKGQKLKGKGVKKEGKGKGKRVVFRAHEIIDGGHRLRVWQRLKQKEIPADVRNINKPADRFMQQYKTNAGHGMRLDKDARDDAIRIAHNVYKVSLSDLAKETGLDRSSIVRIIAQKQRKPAGSKREAKSELRPLPGAQGEMSLEGFIDRVETIYANYARLEAPLVEKLMTINSTYGRSKLGSIVATLRKLADAFEAPLKASKVEKGGIVAAPKKEADTNAA